MNLPIPSWLRPAEAPTPELEAQLAAARTALADAEATVSAALADFDADASPRHERALTEARAAAATAAEYMGRADRLLTSAREREAEAERQRLLAEKRDLLQEIAELERVEREDLVLAEAAVLVELARARGRRERHRRLIDERKRAAVLIGSKLGEPYEPTAIELQIAMVHRAVAVGPRQAFEAFKRMVDDGQISDDIDRRAATELCRNNL